MHILMGVLVFCLGAQDPVLTDGDIYRSEHGWRARVEQLDSTKVSLIARSADRSPCGRGSAVAIKTIAADTVGHWIAIDCRGLGGNRYRIWRETKIVVLTCDGRRLESSRIIGAVDPCGFTIVDNAIAPWLLTEALHGYDGDLRLYVRFSEPIKRRCIERWWIINNERQPLEVDAPPRRDMPLEPEGN